MNTNVFCLFTPSFQSVKGKTQIGSIPLAIFSLMQVTGSALGFSVSLRPEFSRDTTLLQGLSALVPTAGVISPQRQEFTKTTISSKPKWSCWRGQNSPPSCVPKPLALPKPQCSILIAFVLTTERSVGPQHRVINELNIHVFSAKLNLAYLLQVITGALCRHRKKAN